MTKQHEGYFIAGGKKCTMMRINKSLFLEWLYVKIHAAVQGTILCKPMFFIMMKSNWKNHSALFVLTGYLILFFMSVFHTHELSSGGYGFYQGKATAQHTTHHFNENGECIIHLAFSALHNSDFSGVVPDRGQFGDPEILLSALVTPILPISASCKVSRGPPSDNSSI